MPIIDALFVTLLVFLILFVILLSVAALYFIVTMKDLYAAVHEIRNRFHLLAANVSDLQATIRSHLSGASKGTRK